MRRALDIADRLDDAGIRAEVSASLAHVVGERRNLHEALSLTEVTERDVAPDDIVTQVRWRTARARILARGGQSDAANATAATRCSSRTRQT